MLDAAIPADAGLLDVCSAAVTAAVARAGPAVVNVAIRGPRGSGGWCLKSAAEARPPRLKPAAAVAG